MNSHRVFHRLFALFLVCALITQQKAIAQTKCSENQFQASEGMEQMKRAISFSDVAKLKGLLAQGLDLTERDEYCWTILMYAVREISFPRAPIKDISIEIVKTLVDHGADVNVQNNYGGTPLFLASLFDRADLVSLLLLAGADTNIKDDSGETALMYAAWRGNVEMMRALLSRGARVNDQSSDGRTSLRDARREAIPVLIWAGADINATDKMGYTALMHAVINRDTDKIEELLRSGADVNIKAKDGHTALSLVKKNYTENSLTEQLLRQFGAIE
jgi:ankyrin repeat protein